MPIMDSSFLKRTSPRKKRSKFTDKWSSNNDFILYDKNFEEIEHTRAPAGTHEGGQFTSGNYQTIQRLEKEAVVGIKAIDEVVEDLKKRKINVPKTWSSLSKEDQEKVEKSFKEDAFDGQLAYHKGNKEAAEEDLDAQWHGYNEKDKFEMAKMFLPEIAEEPQKFVIPKNFDPLDSGDSRVSSRNDYRDTQIFARAVSIERAAQLMMKAGFFKNIADSRVEAIATDKLIWENWKRSSTSIDGVRIQKACAEEFGTHFYSNPKLEKMVAEIGTIFKNEDQQDQFKIIMRAKWETTQYMLQKANIKNLQLFRAVGISRSLIFKTREEILDDGYTRLPNLEIKRNGAASTSLNRTICNEWGGTGFGNSRVIIRANVPNVAILSVPAYGINEKAESEVVVTGAPWTAWDAWLGKAPPFERFPMSKREVDDSAYVTSSGKLVITFPEEDGTGGNWLTLDRLLKARARRNAIDVNYEESQHPRGPGGRWSNKPGRRISWWNLKPEGEENTGRRPHKEQMLAYIMSKAQETAKQLGFPPGHVSRRNDEYTFTLTGRQRYAAGVAYTSGNQKGRIEIFPHRLDPLSVIGVTAHEVMHIKWQTVYDKYNEERKTVLDLAAQHTGRINPVMAPDDSLKPPYDKQFPVYNALREILHGSKWSQMMEEDGVSQYSEDYWKEAENARGTSSSEAWLKSAIHETLAEIAKQDIETKGEDLKRRIRLREGQPWGDLYRNVNKFYDEIRKKESSIFQ